MGIKTAIIAGLMALAIPNFTSPAIATSGTEAAIDNWELEKLLKDRGDSFTFSDDQDLFSEPFYQPNEPLEERRTFVEPDYQPREQIRERRTFVEPDYQPREQIRERRTFVEPDYQPREQIREQRTFAEPYYQPRERIQPREMTLARGTRGSQVAGLQQRLEVHGFSVGRVDSIFGPRTERSLMEFQSAQGLRPTGVVDRSTWEALSANPRQVVAEEIIKKGDRGSKVKTLQTRLELTGHDPGPVDGVFGPKTLAAVSDFQQTIGLEPTGLVDEKTWMLLGNKFSH